MGTVRKIIIVDDNVRFRTDLKTYVEKQLSHLVIAEASSGMEFLELPHLHSADIILMDIEMDNVDGFAATKQGLKISHELKIIAITMHYERMVLRQLIELGFKGCVFKSDIFKSLPKAIESVCNGHLFFPYDNMPLD